MTIKKATFTLTSVMGLILTFGVSCSADNEKNNIWPRLTFEVKKDPVIEVKVATLLKSMTLEQKIAQMIQPEIKDITVEDMRKYGFGSYLNGGGSFPNSNKNSTPKDWINLAQDMYLASVDSTLDGSNIPTMWGTDAVHGHNNVIGATLFPHNIGLGAMNNPDLVEEIAAITAREVMVTGIDWVFAPTVAVVRDDRWGRTYEGYSEDPEIVKSYSGAVVKGLQGSFDNDFLGDDRVISTVKHFLGDGGTVKGDDQGNNIDSEEDLFRLHAQGYVSGLSVGAQSVMASFNSWHGKKNHGSKYLLTDVLKTRMGFDGFIVGDWNGHGQVEGCTNESCVQAANAGLDIFMVPTDAWKPLYNNLIAQVKNGQIAMSRIDDAVTRILRVKFRAGLFTKPSPAKRQLSGKTELIGAPEHRQVARQAVQESLVLLKNNKQLLPLSPNQHILIAGDAADNIGKQSGGWTISWQGTGNKKSDFPGGTSIYQGFKDALANTDGNIELSVDGSYTNKPDVVIVVFGEEPYAEGHGDIDNIEYQRGDKKDLALLKRFKAQGIPVVAVFVSGRPLWVNAELNASDAFVAAWLPGSEGAGIADVLLRSKENEIKHDFKGRLSYTWPKTSTQSSVNRGDKETGLFAYGYGLDYSMKVEVADTLNEQPEQSNDSDKSLVLFERAPQMPWNSFLTSNGKRVIVESSQQSFGSITVKAIDRDVQEDARLLTFDGKSVAGYQLISNFPEDLRSYDEANSVLVFDLKVNSAVKLPINLAMLCEESCDANVDITNLVNTAFVNTAIQDKWITFAVDLQCFKQKGAMFNRIVSPFSLETAGEINLGLSRVKIQPMSELTSSVQLRKCH